MQYDTVIHFVMDMGVWDTVVSCLSESYLIPKKTTGIQCKTI